MTIYIQSYNNFPFNYEAASAFLGYRENGATIKLFNHIEEVPLNRYSMIIGSIENTHEFFTRMDWNIPKSITYPDQLNSTWWTDREIKEMSLAEALDINNYPYFIKSKELKKFTPGVIEKHSDKKWFNVNQDIPVYISEVINFESEYRIYVLDGKAIGCCYYNGDISLYPDFNVINDMIRQYDQSPKFYSLDVGIVKKGRLNFTFLVECNDGYSLGNYGLQPKSYIRGLNARWRELLEQNPVIRK